MDNPMQPWDRSLASAFQLERSAFTVRFRLSRKPPANASSVYPSHVWLRLNAKSFWMGAHTFCSQTPIQVHLLLSQPMPSNPAEIILLPVITKGIFNCQLFWYFPRRHTSQYCWPFTCSNRIRALFSSFILLSHTVSPPPCL